MPAQIRRFADIESDSPVPLLTRKRFIADRMLLAEVRLEKGCHVPVHHHENEQVSYMVSGKVKWTLGEEGSSDRQEVVLEGGNVLQLPSHFPHGVDVLEDAFIIDILSPPGEMGIDRMAAERAAAAH